MKTSVLSLLFGMSLLAITSCTQERVWVRTPGLHTRVWVRPYRPYAYGMYSRPRPYYYERPYSSYARRNYAPRSGFSSGYQNRGSVSHHNRFR